MRFFILFILCLFTYSQAAAVEVASSKSELQEMGIEIQLLSSIEGLPSCKIGGEINADIGKWLEGNERFFLQTFEDSGDLIAKDPEQGGLSAFDKEETAALLSVLCNYVPNAQIRG